MTRHSLRALIRSIYYRSGARTALLWYHGWRLRTTGGRIRTPSGLVIFCLADDRRAQMLRQRRGRLDRAAIAWWQRLVDQVRPSLLLDVGANYGEVGLSVPTGPKARVVLVEPNPRLAECLRRSSAGMASDISVLEIAASDSAGSANLTVPKSSGEARLTTDTASVIPHDSAVVEVATARLDQLVRFEPDDRVVFKIDVEGHELRVLDGMTRLLESVGAFAGLCEISHLQADELQRLVDLFAVSMLSGTGSEVATDDVDALLLASASGFAKDVILRPKMDPPR